MKIKPLGGLIGAFKTVSTKRWNELIRTPGAVLWQRNYYEHIIRGEENWEQIAEYIQANPLRWEEDENFPLPRRLISSAAAKTSHSLAARC
jgi:putative transposase